jgi:hypothetical protein
MLPLGPSVSATGLARARAALALWMALVLALGAGCKDRPPRAPGETDVAIAAVEIVSADPDKDLALPHGSLFERLGMRPETLLITGRTYSPFREAEDRRRIEAFWQQFGYFDADVSPAEVTFDAESGAATIRYAVRENERFVVGHVEVRGGPESQRGALAELVPFADGHEEVDLEAFRQVRIAQQEHLRKEGWGHANVYARFWVDRAKKKIDVVYFVDAGPETIIASVRVDGSARVPAEAVIARSGLVVGERYTEDLRDRVVRDLLDTGSFASAYVRVDTDTKFIAPGTAPDSGGELRDEQVDEHGDLVPRKLPAGVNVTVHVVEAPRVNVKLKAGAEADPARADTFVGTTFWFRDVLGPMGHLVLEGRIGYGWLYGTISDDPSGVYGEATLRTIHAGALGRLGDLRTTAHYETELYPSAILHALATGPGIRTTITKGLFFDLDLFAVWSTSDGFGPFSAAERDVMSLPDRDDAYGPELDASIVWDAREDPVEPMRGQMLALFTRLSPGDPVTTHRCLDVAPDARLFLPLAAPISVGLRASGEWVFLSDDEGVPLGRRLFGGGSYGLRGFGRQLFSPTLQRCFEAFCIDVPVGGLSLVETSAELRILPPRLPLGGVVFADFGGVSANLNPFDEGVSLAAGAGGRLRLWYLPLAIDASYRIVHQSEVQGLSDSPFHVFFRIGEAF